jgi:hypothetical protein
LFSLFYSTIGKELKFKILIDYKNQKNTELREYSIQGVGNGNDEALKFTRNLFLALGVGAFVLYVILSNLPIELNLGRSITVEAYIYFITLFFGFQSDKEFKEDSVVFVKELLNILINIGAFVFALFLCLHSSNENIHEFATKPAGLVVLAISIVVIVLYSVFKLFPHLTTKLFSSMMKFIFKQIIKYDENDSIAGLLRYFSFLSAATSLIQFVWLFF